MRRRVSIGNGRFWRCWNRRERLKTMSTPTLPGIVSVPSPYSVEETLSKLEVTIASKGLMLFAHIDHGAGAEQAGLKMAPAHVLIFGHAKGGTPLMVDRKSPR